MSNADFWSFLYMHRHYCAFLFDLLLLILCTWLLFCFYCREPGATKFRTAVYLSGIESEWRRILNLESWLCLQLFFCCRQAASYCRFKLLHRQMTLWSSLSRTILFEAENETSRQTIQRDTKDMHVIAFTKHIFGLDTEMPLCSNQQIEVGIVSGNRASCSMRLLRKQLHCTLLSLFLLDIVLGQKYAKNSCISIVMAPVLCVFSCIL